MFYVKQKRGKRYGIVDTDDGIEELYYPAQIKRFYDRGICIEGCSYIARKFVITPVVPVEDKKKAVKNKLSTGSATGIDGFDLEFTEDGRVIAKRLGQKFVEYVAKYHKNNRFVLVIPDVVTDLEDYFLSDLFDNNYKLCINVILPSSLKKIGVDSLSSYAIHDVDISRCNLDLIKHSDRNSSLSLSGKTGDVTLRVKALENQSVTVGEHISHLYLPDIENLASDSLYNIFSGGCIHIGNKLKEFISPCTPQSIFNNNPNYPQRRAESTQMMEKAFKVFIDDESDLDKICINLSKETENSFAFFGSLERKIELYIFIMSRKYYENKFSKIYSQANRNSAIGVLLYDTQEEKEYIKDNINTWCRAPRRYFKKYFSLNSIEKTEIFQLK